MKPIYSTKHLELNPERRQFAPRLFCAASSDHIQPAVSNFPEHSLSRHLSCAVEHPPRLTLQWRDFPEHRLHFCVHGNGSCFFCEAVASPVSRLPATAYCPPAGDPSNRAGGTASHSQKRFPDGLTPVVAISDDIYRRSDLDETQPKEVEYEKPRL